MRSPHPARSAPDDGGTAGAVRLAWEGGLETEVWSRGALLRSLTAPRIDGQRVEVIQAPADLAAAEADTAFHDVVIGPVANRIAGGHFVVDGRLCRLPPNEGPNLLHSGALGWNRVKWDVVEAGPRRCVLAQSAPARDGYPVDVEARVMLELIAADTLEIVWEAEVSAPAPVAMTHHLYLNLSGGAEREVTAHELSVAADAFTPVGAGLIPTGEVRAVEGSPFDLRRPRRIAEVLAGDDPQLRLAGGLDHNWVLRPGADPVLTLRSPTTGLELQLATDQPGVQLYSGQGLAPPYPRWGALVIEPQDFPDAVNQPAFPSVIVRPGAPYRRWARYRFVAGPRGARV